MRVHRSPRVIFRLGLVYAGLVFASCGQSTATSVADGRPRTCDIEVAPGGEGPRILFVGNSLTYWFDIPGIVATLFDDAAVPFARIDMVAEPNFGLPDHWNHPITQDKLELGWDVVILQQGPSATEGRPYLLDYAGRFSGKIREHGGEPALFMVWPSASRSFDFDGVSDSYRTAAEQVDGYLLPAGEAWRAAWDLDPELGLYGGDGYHPSPLGSYLAALTIFEMLTGQSAPALGDDFCVPGFGSFSPSADRVALLRTAAARAVEEFGRTPAGLARSGSQE